MINYDNLTDFELLKLVKDCDFDAERSLTIRYLPVVKKIARSFFLMGGDFEDVIQEGTLGLIFAIRSFSFECDSSFKDYSEICIMNKICSAIKSAACKKNHPLNSCISLSDLEIDFLDASSDISVVGVEDYIISKEELNEVNQKIICCLSDFEKKVLILFLKGSSYGEIALTLNKSQKSIDNALQRIRRKLS